MSRVFISYRHGDAEEERLAGDLAAHLQADGREVFSDKAISVGTDWVAEIDRRLAWCDHFVVLLSEAAMASEMVQAEIRKAAKRRQSDGLPHLLPIRVRYFGALSYELDSILSRIQYARWESPNDTARVLAEIGTALAGGMLPQSAEVSGPHTPTEGSRRPLPKVDPRALTVPGGTLPSDDPLYVAREADKVTSMLATAPSASTLVIRAPRQMGKSSLLIRYLTAALAAKKAVAFIDLSVLTQEDLSTYAAFLGRLATVLHRALRLDRSHAPSVANQQDFIWFIEDVVRAAVGGPLVVAFDEADRLLGRPFQADFFTMLRLWHNNRSNPFLDVWRSVDLALVVSTEPYLLIPEADRSPFNVGRTVSLDGFTLAQCQSLNEAYGALLEQPQVSALWKLVAGHPYLTRLAFYRLTSPDPVPFDTLMRTADDERGPFGDHLRALLSRLHRKTALIDGLRQVIARGTAPTDDAYYRLQGAGLVRRDEGRVVAANALYASFFGRVL
jgi:hypothetical protein